MLDFNLDVWNLFEVICWPTMLVVNPSGLIIAEFRGEVQANYLNKFIPACFKYYANELDHSNKMPSFCSSSLELNSPSSLSSLNFPSKLCMDQTRNVLFVSDSGNNRVLGINTNTNKVELTIGNGERGCANGSFSSSRFDWPQGLAFDSNKNLLYIADTFNDLIRVADLNTKEVSTLCGAINNDIGRYESRKRGFRVWIFKGRVGWWNGNGVLVVRFLDQLVILNW